MPIRQLPFIGILSNFQIDKLIWPRSTMDSIRASEAPDAGSIPAEATNVGFELKGECLGRRDKKGQKSIHFYELSSVIPALYLVENLLLMM